MKRIFDFVLCIALLLLLWPVMVVVAIAVKLNSVGPVLYWSDRIGRDNRMFHMPKFRTMKVGSPTVATHLLADPEQHLTSIGRFLRQSSLDELPQIFSVLIGDMTIVGPRPALYNQYDLIKLRTSKGIQVLAPGVTGWAQVNGRDDLSISEKVDFDEHYLNNRSCGMDFRILVLTVIKVIRRDGIKH